MVLVAVVGTAAGAVWVEQQSTHLTHRDPYNIRVVSAAADRVTLAGGSGSGDLGRYRIEWVGGSAVISDILSRAHGTVERTMTNVTGTALRAGTRVRLEGIYRGDPQSALGLAFENVDLPGSLGSMPAWVVRGSRPTWAVLVHGYGGNRQDGLKWLPALHTDGIPAIDVTYRNDAGAARGPGGVVHFGQTEWRDLEPAVDYARAHGATGVILFGESMGGAVVTEFVRHSPQARLVRGLVLDSPALDFGTDMRFGARAHGLNGPLNWLIIGAGRIAMRIHDGLDFGDLDEIAHAKSFSVPILLVQGDADTTVPPSGADAFARKRPDLVTYLRVHGAAHVEAYDVDPARYDGALHAFFGKVA